ncbi:5767_t:CDS:2 [Entrophospora sp. SA101]|nr:5767_t:CDS:2 [Entrophospora sp. SA101]
MNNLKGKRRQEIKEQTSPSQRLTPRIASESSEFICFTSRKLNGF